MLPIAVRTVYSGKHFFSPDVVDKLLYIQGKSDSILNDQELTVLRLSAKGLSNTSIAQNMNISEKRCPQYSQRHLR